MNQHVPPPNIISPQAVDVPRAQVDAIHCMIDIIDEPYTGDDLTDSTCRTKHNFVADCLVLLALNRTGELRRRRRRSCS